MNQLFLDIIHEKEVLNEATLDILKGGKEGSPDKPGGLSIQLCKSEKKEFYIRYSS